MSNGAPPPLNRNRSESTGDAALVLVRESLSLAAILLASLVVAAGERLGFIPGSGYASSLVLLVMSIWHWRRYSVSVPLVPKRTSNWVFRLVFCLALIVVLLISASAPISPTLGWKPTLLQVAHLFVLVPFAEELYFRGLLLEHLQRGFGPIRAVLLSSLLFAALHQPVGVAVVTGSLAMVACLLVIKGRALVYAVQLHVVWNGLSQIHRTEDGDWRWGCALFASAVVVVLGIAGRQKH